MDFSDGGELQWIKNPKLIDTIATAYFFIRIIRLFSERYFLLSVNRGVSERVKDISVISSNPDIKRLEVIINEGINKAIEHLDKTIKEIQNELK